MLNEYWEKRDTPYSNVFDFWPEWLFQYFGELLLGETIEIVYLLWKS